MKITWNRFNFSKFDQWVKFLKKLTHETFWRKSRRDLNREEIMLCWILHGYFPCSFSSHPRIAPASAGCVQNKCPFKKFKLPECNLVLLTDIWPERKISHRINKVDQDQVKQQQSWRGRRHSSEIRGLCLMKWPSEMLQNLPYFWKT